MPRRALSVKQLRGVVRDGDAFVNAVLSESRKRARDEDTNEMLFAFISKSRVNNVRQAEVQLMSGGLEARHILWIVAEGQRAAYAAVAKGEVIEGGGLCASRNLGIDEARRRAYGYVVELSDDLRRVDVVKAGSALEAFVSPGNWSPPGDLSAANALAKRLGTIVVSPVAAARLIRGIMRETGAKLGGCYPTANPGQACNSPPVQDQHFVVGDFVVVDVSSPLRFDERFVLKEDYDFTCQHLLEYKRVARCSRLLAEFVHRTNSGGAVDARTEDREKAMIALLKHKWPGAFRAGTSKARRDVEVTLRWDKRSSEIEGAKNIDRPPLPDLSCCLLPPAEPLPVHLEDEGYDDDDDDDDVVVEPPPPRPSRRTKLKAREKILAEARDLEKSDDDDDDDPDEDDGC